MSRLFDRLFGDDLHSRKALGWSCLLSFAATFFTLFAFMFLFTFLGWSLSVV